MLVSESSQSRLLLVSSALDVEKYRIDHILFVSVEVTGDECPLLQLPLRRGEARQVQDQRHQPEVRTAVNNQVILLLSVRTGSLDLSVPRSALSSLNMRERSSDGRSRGAVRSTDFSINGIERFKNRSRLVTR